jgi:3-oxoadipate enol-lactonase
VRAAPAGVAIARDGTRLRYALQGGAGGADGIVLVHSLAMDRLFWQPMAERLAGSRPVLTYDCRGHGAPDTIAEQLSALTKRVNQKRGTRA